jgi:hypothetical protein
MNLAVATCTSNALVTPIEATLEGRRNLSC